MMDIYRIKWKPSALKEFKKIERSIIPRILGTIENLSSDPFPSGVRKLQGGEHSYRIRIGDYRIIYVVFESERLIEIARIRHRKEVYR